MAAASGPNIVPILEIDAEAGADLSGKQYYFVKLSASRKVIVCAAATDLPIGVLQNKPTSGRSAQVMVIGKTKVDSDAALAAKTLIGPASDGQADPKVPGTDTTEYICGQVVLASAAAGDMAEAVINCANPARAA
jgi:hypothetical protein